MLTHLFVNRYPLNFNGEKFKLFVKTKLQENGKQTASEKKKAVLKADPLPIKSSNLSDIEGDDDGGGDNAEQVEEADDDDTGDDLPDDGKWPFIQQYKFIYWFVCLSLEISENFRFIIGNTAYNFIVHLRQLLKQCNCTQR